MYGFEQEESVVSPGSSVENIAITSFVVLVAMRSKPNYLLAQKTTREINLVHLTILVVSSSKSL